MSWFRRRPCETCKAKDSEIAFLREMLTSSRLHREPVEEPAKAEVKKAELVPDEDGTTFNRWPITEAVYKPSFEEVTEDEVRELSEARRASLAARRESN